MRGLISSIVLVISASASAGAAQAGCGEDAAPCALPDGHYQLRLPVGTSGDIPAMVFLHGHSSSGASVMRMQGMVEAVLAHGYAVIAPDGSRNASGTQSWDFRGTRSARDDYQFLTDVLADAKARHGIDAEHSVLAGFSSGAFMVNYFACARPDGFAAYLPVSGGFWRPQPEACAGPVALYHAHGWKDGVVPLEGRVLRADAVQGDIWAGLELWRDTNTCPTHAPNRMWQEGDLSLRAWSCAADIRMELFPGGHMVPPGWASRVLDWVDALAE